MSNDDIEQYRKWCIDGLNQMKSDDVLRAKHAFRGLTPEQMQMQMPHGQNPQTRAQVLAGYEARDAKINAAIEWVTHVGR